MARTIKLKESDLTKIVRRISEQQLITEKWDWAKLKRDLKNIASWVGIFNGIFSDSRLKKNITRVGKSPSGIPIYEWEYKNKVRFGGGTYRGVLAEHTPKKAVRLQSNGYKSVNYNMIDVAFEKVNSNNKKIKLSERDLTNVIKKVLNEKLYEPLDDRMGGPGGTFPDNPFDDDGFGGFGGMSQGGGSNDPMGRGNEEMETRGGSNATDPTQHPQYSKFMGDGQRYKGILQQLVNEPEMRGHERALTEFIGIMDRMMNDPMGITPEEVKAAGRKWWQLWGHIKDRYWIEEEPTTDASDIRLKENITKTGVSKSGIPTYTFNYKNDDKLWSGTMAQDLLNMGLNEAVSTMDNGYYAVNYNMIDVDMVSQN